MLLVVVVECLFDSMRSNVLRGYRAFLLTIRTVFGADKHAVATCRRMAREAFEKNKAERSPERVQQMLLEAEDAMDFLRTNIAQAQLNGAGRYEMKVAPQQTPGVVSATTNSINLTNAHDAAKAACGEKREGKCEGCDC